MFVFRLVIVALLLGLPAAPAMAMSANGAQEQRCAITDWRAQWGVKESFRAYLSSSIAGGEWITQGNVDYETPLFQFRGTSGSVSEDLLAGELSSTGSLRFIGHDGLLDQTLSEPRVRLGQDQWELVFNVSGDTQEGVSVDAADVAFVTIDVSQARVDAEAGVWELTAGKTQLTSAGAEAFGTYPPGEPFDPIDMTLTTQPGCLAPPGTSGLFLGLAVGSLLSVTLAIVLVRKWRGQERQ